MITQTASNDAFTASINAYPIPGQSRIMVYTGERTIITIHNATAASVMFEINDIAYHSNASGDLTVDVTDLVRASASLYTQMDIDIEQGADNLAFELKFHAGIYPEHLLLPPPPAFAGDGSITTTQILPPCVFYQHPVLSLAYSMAMEVYGVGASAAWVSTFYDNYQEEGTETPSNGQLVLPNVNTRDDPDWVQQIEFTDEDLVYKQTLLRDCDNACVLQWVSQSGVTKRAIWRYKKVQKNAVTQKLLVFGDGYKWQRGHEVQIVAYIEGLDAYSAAYYSDIVLSGNVHCAMVAGENLNSDFTSVSVQSDAVLYADGDAGATQTLEIVVNFKKYDVL